MAAIAIVLLVTILCVAHFYLKSDTLTSFVSAIIAVLSVIVAFGFSEQIGGLIAGKNILPAKATGLSFLLLFGLTFGILKALAGLVIGSKIEYPNAAKITVALVCGAITGLIVSGCLLVALGSAGVSSKLSYKRFDGTITANAISNPKKSLLGTDDMVANLFGWISNGSMSGKKSFKVYHADFVNQMHLNKHLSADGVISVSGPGAISIPKLGVREKETNDGEKYTSIRMEIKATKLDKGGATDEDGKLAFGMFQVRLVCTNPASGDIKVLYPKSIKVIMDSKGKGKMIKEFGETINIERDQLTSSKLGVVDLQFNIPSNLRPQLLEFKNNAVVSVPPVTKDEETEDTINAVFKKPE